MHYRMLESINLKIEFLKSCERKEAVIAIFLMHFLVIMILCYKTSCLICVECILAFNSVRVAFIFKEWLVESIILDTVISCSVV